MPISMTKTQIISNALTQMGKSPIVSLDGPQPPIVTAAVQAFDMLLPSEMAEHQWRFSAKIAQLSQLEESPIIPYWQYIYELPDDYIKMVRLWPPNLSFEIYEDAQLYTNFNNPLWIEYICLPEITRLPPSFCSYFSYLIAEYLALSNAQKTEYAQYLSQKVAIKRSKAMAFDAQNRPQGGMISMPMIDNRFISGPAAGVPFGFITPGG